VYRWEANQEQNYTWWIERLRTAFGRFDLNRLDHFIGFVRSYEVPAQARTAVNGQYQPGGGASFFEAVRKAFGVLPLIADDLGASAPEVTALLDKLQIPGTRVLQFELGSDPEANSAPAARHPAKSVVYTGTHDNNTAAGWYRTLLGAQREVLQEQLNASGREVVWAMIREALASPSDTAIVPAQDLLELGSEARMNSPGTPQGNWRWRLKEGELTKDLAQRLRDMTGMYGRLVSGQNLASPSTSSVRTRAYELYERRGRQDGQAAQDWLNAEREIAIEAKP
jgi:4-alpha-glucanotransferase